MPELTEQQFFARFENAFNQTHQLQTDVTTLKANVAGIQNDLVEVSKSFSDLSHTVGKSLESLTAKMEENTKSLLARIETRTAPNYLAYGLIVPLVLALFGAAWATITNSIDAKLIEVETQFRKDEDMNNVRLAHTERALALIWNSEHPNGPQWPVEPYFYPNGNK